MTWAGVGPQHTEGPITITVDHPDRPSQTIDNRGKHEPAWLAKLWGPPEGSGHIEAISIGGPGAAASMALSIYSRRKR